MDVLKSTWAEHAHCGRGIQKGHLGNVNDLRTYVKDKLVFIWSSCVVRIFLNEGHWNITLGDFYSTETG